MRFGTGARLVLLATVLLAPAVVAHQLPGEVERDGVQAELHRYHSSIDAYRDRAPDVLQHVLSWDKGRTGRLLRAIGTARDERRPWGPQRFKAAVMLHTDAAVHLLDRADADAALPHLDAAIQLLGKAGAAVNDFAGRWYQGVARLLRGRNMLADAERVLAAGRERLPGDATVMYESGALQESLAGETALPAVVHVAHGRGPSSPPAGDAPSRISSADIDDLNRRRTARLRQAEEWLRVSVARDPSNPVARLHLARVQMLRGAQAAALALFRAVAAEDDGDAGYLADLFAGAVHEREGRLEAAAEAYGAAARRRPRSHAAHVALSAVLQRAGRTAEAREALGRVLDAATASRREPWWTYSAEHPRVNYTRMEQLRAEARQ